jgi:mRNA interferase RelE/StbE
VTPIETGHGNLFARIRREVPSAAIAVRERIESRIRQLGGHLESFPHTRLQWRPEFRLRIGDYRVIYEFDLTRNELFLVTLGHRREVYR